MVARNEITGDKIQSKLSNKQYEDNFDKIFSKKDKVESPTLTTDKPLEPTEDWDEARIDVIGCNGNDGLHYKEQAENE